MNRRRGFTLIEVLIVIAIIAVLSSMVILGYKKVQANTRDEIRHAKATAISEGLEKYYEKNGEYPSVASLANTDPNNSGDKIASILSVPLETVRMPNTPSTISNSLAPLPSLNNDYVAYIASRDTDNASCQNNKQGGCDTYTLKYLEESGEEKTIESRHRSSISTGPPPPPTPNVPAAPSTTITVPGSMIIADISAVTCTPGTTAQYSIRQKANAGTYGAWSSWTTATQSSLTPSPGYRYFFQAKARCVFEGVDGGESIGSEASYTHPITTAPTVPLPTVSSDSSGATWTWSAPSCPTGAAPEYRTYQVSDMGVDSGWGSPYGGSASFRWSYAGQGYEYTVQVQQRCVSNYTEGPWSTSGSASYIRPVNPPSTPTNFTWEIQRDYSTLTWRWNPIECGAGMYFNNINQLYQDITGTSGSWLAEKNWGTHAYNPTNASFGSNGWRSGSKSAIRVRVRCVNNVTGRASAWSPTGTSATITIP